MNKQKILKQLKIKKHIMNKIILTNFKFGVDIQKQKWYSNKKNKKETKMIKVMVNNNNNNNFFVTQ